MNNNQDSSIILPETSSFPKPRQEKVYHFLLMGAATIVILAGIKAASDIVSPMLLALFTTIILVVPLRWLRQKGCPSSIALIIVLGGTIFAFSAVSYLVGRSLNDFILRLPAYKNRIVQKLEQLDKQLEQYGFVLGELGREKLWNNFQPAEQPSQELLDSLASPNEIPTEISSEKLKEKVENSSPNPKNPPKEQELKPTQPVKQEIVPKQHHFPVDDFFSLLGFDSVNLEQTESMENDDEDEEKQNKSSDTPVEIVPASSEEIDKILNKQEKETPSLIALNPESVMYWVTKSLVELRKVIEGGFLVLIFTVFMIFEASRFPEKIDRAFGKDGPINNEHFHRIAADVRRYLFLKAIANIMSAGAATFVYWIFGVPATLFWGVVAYFLYFIPNIGGTMAAILPGMLIFMTYDVQGVLLYALCLVAIECTIAYGIEPKMLGHGLRLSTVVIILSLFSWGWLLGPVGLFLAAPLTIVVKIIFQAFKETEWIAILLDDQRTHRQRTSP